MQESGSRSPSPGLWPPTPGPSLRHTARSREGFARGALKAAQWVVGKKGFYEFGEIL
jgi:4-hydroxy-tetrahydrodipicolinate reductase